MLHCALESKSWIPEPHWQVPSIFSRQEGYDHSPALFGFPPHAGRITQNIIYADDTICDRVDTTKGYPRTPNNPSWAPPFILMVDRGHCTFLQQVSAARVLMMVDSGWGLLTKLFCFSYTLPTAGSQCPNTRCCSCLDCE